MLQARVAVETARIQLGYTKIVAPIAGRIGRSAVTDGALVTAYQPMALATIQQLNPIYVDVPQSTSQLLSLKKRLAEGKLQKSDEQVGLVLEDGSAYGVKGKLQFHEVTVDPSTGSVILRMVFDNAEGMLLPGMFVKAVVPEGTKEQAILVPHRAINRDNRGEPWVFVVEEGKAIQRKIVTDREIGGSWLVTEGLKVGDRVIVEGAHGLIKVRPGMGVREPAPKKE
ncbi:MAG: efflux RND transporter periplasmic adaptor subunit [Phycisphaerales bacterium]|nr:efflux RND transporter periplasmic adaptor subunit [Phycisphaerales bacterium]